MLARQLAQMLTLQLALLEALLSILIYVYPSYRVPPPLKEKKAVESRKGLARQLAVLDRREGHPGGCLESHSLKNLTRP